LAINCGTRLVLIFCFHGQINPPLLHGKVQLHFVCFFDAFGIGGAFVEEVDGVVVEVGGVGADALDDGGETAFLLVCKDAGADFALDAHSHAFPGDRVEQVVSFAVGGDCANVEDIAVDAEVIDGLLETGDVGGGLGGGPDFAEEVGVALVEELLVGVRGHGALELVA